MSTKYDKIKDTSYCFYAMHGFSITAHGTSRLCCVSEGETSTFYKGSNDRIELINVLDNKNRGVPTENLEDFINDSKLMNIRKQMLQGERPSECYRCWNLEDQGIQSFRQINNHHYNESIDKNIIDVDKNGYLNKNSVKYLDITLGNICNLKCRSCNPWNSHRWIDEGPYVPHHGWEKSAYDRAKIGSEAPWFEEAFKQGFFDSVLPRVEVINFLGGEPLVVEEHYAWLERIIQKGFAENITLQYNTNVTTLPDKILKIWKNFKGINIGLSIDAVGDLAFYVRHPSKWKVIEKNIKKLAEFSKEHKTIYVQTHVTLSALNIHDLPNILDWCKNNYNTWHYSWDWGTYGYQNCVPLFNMVENPNFLHIKHLPDEEKNLLNQMLDDQYDKFSQLNLDEWEYVAVKNILGIKNTLNQQRDDKLWQNLLDNTLASDKFRKIDVKDYIPWIGKYF